MPGWLKKALDPRVLLPAFLIVVVVAVLFAFGNPKKILATMERFDRLALIWVFLLSLVYEALRFAQWMFLLRHEGVHVPVKAQIFSFAGGEATRFVPVGNYFQNYLLATAEGTDFAFSSAASTMIILFEVLVSLLGVVVLGLGALTWMRWVVLAGLIATGIVVWLLRRFHGTLDTPRWIERHARARRAWEDAAEQVRSFARGGGRLLNWRTLAISFVLAAAYLVAGAAILYVVLAGLGWSRTAFGDVLAVYFFSLAFGLIFPLPVDLGVTELSGVGAFLAVGVDRDVAIGSILVNRVLTILASIAIALVISAVLRDEAARAIQARGARRTGQFGQARGGGDEAGPSDEGGKRGEGEAGDARGEPDPPDEGDGGASRADDGAPHARAERTGRARERDEEPDGSTIAAPGG